MKWFVIISLLVAAFGPILWLMPKARDRRLTRLRMAARQKGISVELARLRDPNPKPQDRVSSGGVVRAPVIRCAGYRRFAERPAPHMKAWRIERGDSDVRERLSQCWELLPKDWLVVEVDAIGACLYWREEVSAENLDAQLDAVNRVLSSLLRAHVEDATDNQNPLGGD